MLKSHLINTHIPPQFKDGSPIDKILLVSDVDGVIRHSTEEDADPRIITSIRELIADKRVDVAFISGTPVAQAPFLEIWRRGNVTLDKAVGSLFAREVEEKRITIYGALGGQRLTHEHLVETIDEYSLDIAFEMGKLLLLAFLEEIKNEGTLQQKSLVDDLEFHIQKLKLINKKQSSLITADEFREIIFYIRSNIDPNFRLISYGSFVESQTSSPQWNTAYSFNWLKNQLDHVHPLISQLGKEQKQVGTGLAFREDENFNFLAVSKINKSFTIQKHLEEKLASHPDALIVTIGDAQVDFPMHQHAHLAYHVGQEHVWKNHQLSQCMLVRDTLGRDSQHVAGTLHVLNILKNGIGKSIFDWNFIP